LQDDNDDDDLDSPGTCERRLSLDIQRTTALTIPLRPRFNLLGKDKICAKKHGNYLLKYHSCPREYFES